jgi:hypothetical protein
MPKEIEPETRQRTEEVQNIIERMPTNFGLWVTLIITSLVMLLTLFGWLIKYPDVVMGQIVINSNVAPLKLISNSSGKLKLLKIESKSTIRENEIIAYIESSANINSVMQIEHIIRQFDPNSDNPATIQHTLPDHVSLGELNSKYYVFKNSLQEAVDYEQDKPLTNQKRNIVSLLAQQQVAIAGSSEQVQMEHRSMVLGYKSFKRDSILFIKKVISEAEFDNSQLSYVSSMKAYQNALNNLNNAQQAAQQTKSKVQDLSIQDPEKNNELKIALLAAYNDLRDNITAWEQKFVFRAPFDGRIQFLKFYNNGEYIQSGEPIFTIIPNQRSLHGEVMLPAKGSGKITEGQSVMVKLDSYPYLEYGLVKGKVSSISLSTNITQSEMKEVENYLVLVDFPEQLKTNYGAQLKIKSGAKGTAEIITSDRRLIERVFDNLTYALRK